MRAVRFEQYGGVEVLQVVEVPRPVLREGEVLVRVTATSINPGEAKIRAGLLHDRFPATFPSGEGSDLAGVVVELGPGVTELALGNDVFGFTDERAAQAELVAVPVGQLAEKPVKVPFEVAGALYVAGATAWAAVRAVDLHPGDTVVISAAAGGVGSIAIQLATRTGANVIGIAGPDNHEWLRSFGVTPVAHGEGLVDRIRKAAPGGVDAFIDLFGAPYVQIAVDLGVAIERIDTIADFDAVARLGVQADGNAAGGNIAVLTELAGLVAAGELVVPIAATYPLERVRDAYAELANGHTRGKIVLTSAGPGA